MILHIGDNKYILKEEIIVILDRNSAETTKKTRETIDKLIESNCFIGELNTNIKSYIFVFKNKKTIIYTSKISAKTLLNRSINVE